MKNKYFEVEKVKLREDIRKARKVKRLSQWKLAQKMQLLGCDIDVRMVTKFELGVRNLNAIELLAMGQVLDIDLNEYGRELVKRMKEATA